MSASCCEPEPEPATALPGGGPRSRNSTLTLARSRWSLSVSCVGARSGGSASRSSQEMGRVTRGGDHVGCEFRLGHGGAGRIMRTSEEVRNLPGNELLHHSTSSRAFPPHRGRRLIKGTWLNSFLRPSASAGQQYPDIFHFPSAQMLFFFNDNQQHLSPQ